MSYTGSTQFYRIPYLKTGDYITESEEERRAKIIDNLLYVATYGAIKAIVQDAQYTLTDSAEDPCKLTIEPEPGSDYVFLAVVNYRLAYRTDTIEFTLVKGEKYYVYLSYTDGMEIEPLTCLVSVSTEEIDDAQHILLCTLDYTGDEAVLDTESDKQYLSNLAAHTMDNVNPHGTKLYQSTLLVIRGLAVRANPVYPYVIRDVEVNGSTPVSVEVEDMVPKFVTVMSQDSSIGDVLCVINNDNTISVSNSGSAGTVQLKIEGVYSTILETYELMEEDESVYDTLLGRISDLEDSLGDIQGLLEEI